MEELITRLSRYSKQCLAERLDEDFAEAVEEAKQTIKAARNELCLHCGRYKKAYMGQCDGCRWQEDEDG